MADLARMKEYLAQTCLRDVQHIGSMRREKREHGLPLFQHAFPMRRQRNESVKNVR